MKYLKHALHFAIISLTAVSAFGQQKNWLDSKLKKLNTSEGAEFYTITTTEPETSRTVEKTYTVNDNLISSVSYSDSNQKVREGKYERWNGNGQLQYSSEFKDNKLHGNAKMFYNNGVLMRDENYDQGVMIDGKCYTEDGVEIPWFEYETKPEYPGGTNELYKFIGETFKIKAKDSGRMIVQFVINREGYPEDIKIVKSLNERLDKEAIRVIKKMKRWQPGMQNGKPVRVMYSLPISLKAP